MKDCDCSAMMKCHACKDRHFNELPGEIRLNLGSRDTKMPGFMNMDCDPHTNVDIVGDISDLGMFDDGRISDIYASNVLEHFPHPETGRVLGEWYRVLKPGGKLYLSVPDFKRAVEIYLLGGLCDWVQNSIVGDQGYRTAFHYAIFDEERISGILAKEGFKGIEFVSQLPIGPSGDCSRLLSSADMRPVSLNLIARKG